ncbi:hypothetical protein [Geomicrobium sp. JCM 19055]|uniref:hypothetical protein n=1 Tax=Geomicrobium sp. JCM 19055 TaxID=1460649 RepID=UPI0022360366|nr:hypothetical protein [Geomicrobium sp. JCM 19055]
MFTLRPKSGAFSLQVPIVPIVLTLCLFLVMIVLMIVGLSLGSTWVSPLASCNILSALM